MTNYESGDYYTTVLTGGTGSLDTVSVSSPTTTNTVTLSNDPFTGSSGATITTGNGPFQLGPDNITINTDMLSNQTLTVGDVTLSQSTLKDLVTLIDVLKELDDDNPLKALFDSKKMLDKIKGE